MGIIEGQAIQVSGSRNIVIDNCRFINFESGVYLSSTSDSTIRNSYFTDTTTHVITSEIGTRRLILWVAITSR